MVGSACDDPNIDRCILYASVFLLHESLLQVKPVSHQTLVLVVPTRWMVFYYCLKEDTNHREKVDYSWVLHTYV